MTNDPERAHDSMRSAVRSLLHSETPNREQPSQDKACQDAHRPDILCRTTLASRTERLSQVHCRLTVQSRHSRDRESARRSSKGCPAQYVRTLIILACLILVGLFSIRCFRV